MSSPTRPERGGAARVTAHGDPGVQATPGSFGAAPVVPGFSLRCPSTSLGGGGKGGSWPGPLGSDRLFLSGVRVSRTAARAAGSPSACASRVREPSPP